MREATFSLAEANYAAGDFRFELIRIEESSYSYTLIIVLVVIVGLLMQSE